MDTGFTWLAVAALLLVVGGMLAGCERQIIFQPMKFPAGFWDASRLPFSVEDIEFDSADGTKLHGWFVSRPGARGTLLWCHGNAGNLSHRADNIHRLAVLPLNIFIFDYRGYGKSAGVPDEAGVYQDALAAYDTLVEGRGVRPETLILFGRSLGGAVAVHLAKNRPAAGLILESAFTSAADMAKEILPLMPSGLVRAKLDVAGEIASLAIPKLFLHGDRDEVVPYAMGEALFKAAKEPKTFYTIPGAGHNDTYQAGGKAYFEAWAKFIDKVLPPAGS